MQKFTDQTVFVTGGTRGQGAAHVRAFHAEGARVVIAATNRSAGEHLAADLGSRAMFVPLDVSNERDWESAVEAAELEFGPIGVLVNNAGVQNAPATIEATDRSIWDRTLGVNLTGAFLGIAAATPSLRRNGGGVIVNIGSTMAFGGTALFAPYVAAKWALRGLTQTAALELGRDNIRVNSIHPGVVATALINDPIAGAPPISDFYSPAPYAVPRLGVPADITSMLLYLASDDASFVTGSEFIADGGLSLGPALQSDAA